MKGPAIGVVSLLASAALAAAPPPLWKAAASSRVITPAAPIWLSGYEDRTHPSEGVLRDLYVKALALEDESGRPAVLVTADILGYTRETAAAVAERCSKQFGIPRDRLVLNASHTHSAPVIDPPIWPSHPLMPVTQHPAIRRYGALLVDKTVEAVADAIQHLAPARLRFAQGFASIGVNRRRAVISRALTGQVDQDVPVLAVESAAGKLIALVAGYACHATVLNGYPINGDWPGFAQAEMESRHPGAVAMYVQGCAADTNPLPRRSVALARTYGRILDAAVEDVLAAPMAPVAGPLGTAYGTVDLPFQKDAGHYAEPVQVWKFGPGIRFIVLGGEVVSGYSLRLKRQYGFDDTWVAAYSNDVFGYVGSRRVIEEGGYEGGGANTAFPGPFQPEVEDLIVAKVADLIKRVQ